MLMSRREFHLDTLNFEQLTIFIDNLKDYLSSMQVPPNYSISIEKDVVVCCGIMPIGAIIDIEGCDESVIRDLDFELYAKMIDLCERNNINAHEARSLEIL